MQSQTKINYSFIYLFIYLFYLFIYLSRNVMVKKGKEEYRVKYSKIVKQIVVNEYRGEYT